MVEFQCAVAARDRTEPMFATASNVRRWLLIEVRGAWGRDAIPGSELARTAPPGWARRMAAAGIRLIAVRRDLDRNSTAPLQLFYAETGAGASRGRCWRRHADSAPAVLAATDELPADGDGRGWDEHGEAVVLVCTNGRHDPCCATFGRPLVRALRGSEHTDAVWESSHIGGDRFAGNLVILPEGLYFGRCDEASAGEVLDAYRRGEILLDHYRGRSALGFHEQAAEYFVRRELGLSAIDAVGGVRRVDAATGTFTVDVSENGSRRTLRVAVTRHEVATAAPLTCTGPSDQLVPSYELVSIDPT
jgi:hypothetical protein